MRVVTHYAWHTGKLEKALQIAVVSDLHDESYADIWPQIEGADCLLVPGDVVNRYKQSCNRGLMFLEEAAERLPTFFSAGNHEMRIKSRKNLLAALEKSKANILMNTYVRFGEVWIGGWYRPALLDMPDMIDEFEKLDGCKILLCHRPEDYIKHLREKAVDLVVAGHAHGGQIRVGNQGLYAPGQGIFPKYTYGIADECMLISAGAGNPIGLPRWNNPCEILRITLD